MFLTQLVLDPRHTEARRDLASPYELHRTLSRAVTDGTSERLLYRLEAERPTDPRAVLLVQTVARPDWSFLDPGYARALRGPKPFDLAPTVGQHLAFRLVANPTKRATSTHDPSKKTRVPLKKEASSPEKPNHQTHFEWLDRKGAQCGFKLLRSEDGVPTVQAAPFHVITRKVERREGEPPKTHRITLFGVRFDGMLRVTDPDKLVEAVRQGIGPAKAFGFGLLSLAPAR